MRRLHDLWRRGRRAARNATPDAELLERFVRHGDHAAFAELVDRLGPLVYATCRRLLPNPADVEDAFQATFLVLVRRADTLAGRSVGPWLHRVAIWTARSFRRRNASAARLAADPPQSGSSRDFDATDARLDIDAAVSALPEKYRVAVILCHLQGWTRRELAAHLGCPESTASSLVGRGLAKLKKRLAGRDPAMVLAVAGAAAVPSGLSASAVRAACLYRTSSLAAAASPAVAELTEGVLRMFRMKKLAAGAAAAVLVIGLGFGLTLGTGSQADAQAPKASQPPPSADEIKDIREKLEKAIAATNEQIKRYEVAKDVLKQLEIQKRDYENTLQNLNAAFPAKNAPDEPYIGLWVRNPNNPAPLPGSFRDTDPTVRTELLAATQRYLAGGGSRSEFAINEIYGKGKPVVEAHFYDVRSLQTYLTRAAKDPAAPKKLRLYIDKEYPWEKAKAVIDACKAAGFGTIELAAAPADGTHDVKPPLIQWGPSVLAPAAPANGRAATDEGFFRALDLRKRRITVVRTNPTEYLEGTETAFTLHPDAYLFSEDTGKRREWTDLKYDQRLRMHLSTHEGGSVGMPVLRVGIVSPAKPPMPAYIIEAPDILKIRAGLRARNADNNPKPDIHGEFLVRPDGTVHLPMGTVSVAGLTLADAADAVRKKLIADYTSRRFVVTAEEVTIVLDVMAFNSKQYYVITDDENGEQQIPLPLTGNETVLDAVGQVQGLSKRTAGVSISVIRLGPDGKPLQELPVDLPAIQQGNTATNYQLLPGDRVLVKVKKEPGGR